MCLIMYENVFRNNSVTMNTSNINGLRKVSQDGTDYRQYPGEMKQQVRT